MLTALQVFFAVFGVMDPVGNVPVFLALTGNMSEGQKRRVAVRAVARAAVLLLIFVLAGSAILGLFQVSLESFRLAGGLIMVLIGLQILFNISIGGQKEQSSSSDDISVVPLATPLIAGPGMLATSVVLAKEYGYAITLLALAANLLLEVLLFTRAGWILKKLGHEGTLAFAKVMGLILVTIGIEFIRSALV